MAALIAMVRRLIADPPGEGQAFSDEEIQAELDDRRVQVRYERLEPVEEFSSSGVSRREFRSRYRYWEDGAALCNGSWQPLAYDAETSEPLAGRWRFAESQASVVLASGFVYEPYGAAAALCDRWAAKLKLEYDFSLDDGRKFARTQRLKALADAAKTLRMQAPVIVGSLHRSDC